MNLAGRAAIVSVCAVSVLRLVAQFHPRWPGRLAALAVVSRVGQIVAAPLTLPLWDTMPSSPPGAVAESIDAAGTVSNVSVPVMSVHLPERAAVPSAALILCPGGSYSRIGLFTTGMGAKDWFVSRGVAIIVLKYRTRPPSTDVTADALLDAKRALRLMRMHAAEWNIDPQRIGMVGSSAGAHLVLNLATHWDRGDPQAANAVERQSCRPDFIGLLCPWPNRQPVADFPVDEKSPPAFVASARDDQIAPTAFAEGIAAAYSRAGVECRLWLLEKGGHTAFKLGGRASGATWPEEFSAWQLRLSLGAP